MHARFQHRMELASLARDGNAGPIHEDMNSFSRPAQRLKEQKRVGEEFLETVVRTGDKAQRQREHGFKIERVGRQQREIELVAGRRA